MASQLPSDYSLKNLLRGSGMDADQRELVIAKMKVWERRHHGLDEASLKHLLEELNKEDLLSKSMADSIIKKMKPLFKEDE